MFELGGNDVSQFYRSIRIARLTEKCRVDKFKFEPMPDIWSQKKLNIQLDIEKNPKIIVLGLGIRYADFENMAFAGWVKYSIKHGKSYDVNADNWISFYPYTIPYNHLSKKIRGVSNEEILPFIDSKIEEFCKKILLMILKRLAILLTRGDCYILIITSNIIFLGMESNMQTLSMIHSQGGGYLELRMMITSVELLQVIG